VTPTTTAPALSRNVRALVPRAATFRARASAHRSSAYGLTSGAVPSGTCGPKLPHLPLCAAYEVRSAPRSPWPGSRGQGYRPTARKTPSCPNLYPAVAVMSSDRHRKSGDGRMPAGRVAAFFSLAPLDGICCASSVHRRRYGALRSRPAAGLVAAIASPHPVARRSVAPYPVIMPNQGGQGILRRARQRFSRSWLTPSPRASRPFSGPQAALRTFDWTPPPHCAHSRLTRLILSP
jgi:hypothetical protein